MRCWDDESFSGNYRVPVLNRGVMKQTTEDATLSLLLMTSDETVESRLRRTLGAEFVFHLVRDDAASFALPNVIPDIDAVLIIREAISTDYLDSLSTALVQAPVPVAIFVKNDPERLATRAIRSGVTSFVVAGFEPARIPTLIELTIERFKLQQALQNELLKSQEELAARKIIERAKGMLMDKKNLNEQQAYRSLRELAMRQSKPIKEVAETLLLYSDILP